MAHRNTGGLVGILALALIGLLVMAGGAGLIAMNLLGPAAPEASATPWVSSAAPATPEAATAAAPPAPSPSATIAPSPTRLAAQRTATPPLANADFPTQAVTYPAEWPVEARYPGQFTPVGLASGQLPGSSSTGWSAKLRYAGRPQSAADELAAFFTAQGWQIMERTDLEAGGVVLLIQNDNRKSGVVIVDLDTGDRSQSVILATVFR